MSSDFSPLSAGNWVYCVGEDGYVRVYDATSGALETSYSAVADDPNAPDTGAAAAGGQRREVIGVAHHPLQNMLATFTDDGLLRIWRP